MTSVTAVPASPSPPLAGRLRGSLEGAVVGQEDVVERVLVALLAGGHVLLEGVPGLAKTLLVRTLARAVQADFRRIQFTPDLLPADILGSLVLRPEGGGFAISPGPIFSHLVLADEINRAPAKVQSALLEAMEEGQVTLGGRTLPLPEPFMVLATQNPLEHHGTYPLAEAQLDRFLMMVRVAYPDADAELTVLRRALAPAAPSPPPVATAADVVAARREVRAVRVEEGLLRYVLAIVRATRDPSSVGAAEMRGLVSLGASPRAGLALVASARARAWLLGRDYATPDDVKVLAPDVLRHRVILAYEAGVRGVDAEQVVAAVLDRVEVP
ncbi:MAG TPA: MoxR family ATPase [Longimicrobiales bacterium]|nr:MoxR family ATPase [Longimicrobiales bacterium]